MKPLFSNVLRGVVVAVAIGAGMFSTVKGRADDESERLFLRGDVNDDGRVDISDTISLLSYLFQGGPAALCMAAADADDNEAIEITDVIRLFDSIFLSGSSLPAPGSTPGSDPTPGIGCTGEAPVEKPDTTILGQFALGTGSTVGTYRLPFDNKNGGWGLGNGNFDDPLGYGYGHGLGQPFAWDFGYSNAADPSGVNWGRIYAARAGTVIDVRDGVTAVLSTSDPVLGPGNYILIRHADSTISAYDHLKVNSIRVSVGEYVAQSTWIATVGNTGSTSGGVVHLHFECHSWGTTNKVGDPTNLSAGPSILIHFTDEMHTAWRPVDYDSFGANSVVYRQDGWRFCYKCAGLYFSYQGDSGVCPTGGTHATTGGNYILTTDANALGQTNWKWCKKCAGLFFAGNPGSKCPVTTPTSTHDVSTIGSYHLFNNVTNDPGQHHWRWCSKCQGMWFGDAAKSVCPANAGGPHSMSGSGDYSISVTQEDTQQNWKWCNKCKGLFYAPNGPGVCKAGGGHSSTGSANYTLCLNVSPVNSTGTPQQSVPPNATGWQGGWRYCDKCGLLWMGLNSGSHCPKGGTHSGQKSGNYYLPINNAASNSGLGQVGWRWCSKCQGFWMGLNSGSKCSADGLAHSSSGSGKYVLSLD